MDTEQSYEKIVALAQLSLRFGRVDRVTFHEDGTTPESDTDHTVMLSLLACSIAHSYLPQLDTGKIAELALVHDLVEAYAGDTPTFKPLSKKQQEAKEKREHDAYLRIKQELGEVFPWVHERISEYEERKSPESRFVKAIDKLVPKITHILNKGTTLRSASVSQEDNALWNEAEMLWAKEYLEEFSEFKEVYLAFLKHSRTVFCS